MAPRIIVKNISSILASSDLEIFSIFTYSEIRVVSLILTIFSKIPLNYGKLESFATDIILKGPKDYSTVLLGTYSAPSSHCFWHGFCFESEQPCLGEYG